MNWERFVLELTTDLQGDDLEDAFEEKLASFDYKEQGADLLFNYIQPELEKIQRTLLANEEKATRIYKDAGLSDIEIAWKMYNHAKPGLMDVLRLKRLGKETSLLVDTEIGLWTLRKVILHHRPDLHVEIGQLILIEGH